MNDKSDILDIVDENDVVIGQDTRTNIHAQGLLHREIHICFITPSGNMIFQHRAKDKDTYPNLLDATVGGHVEPGMTYEETAIKEMEEETGIRCKITDLHMIKKMKRRAADPLTNTINNSLRVQYAYIFRGNIADLKIEKGKTIGFEEWSVDKIINLTEEEKKRFVPLYRSSDFLAMFKDLLLLVNK